MTIEGGSATFKDTEDLLVRQREQIYDLRNALLKYGRHKKDCPGKLCTCGLKNILDENI